MASSLRVVLRPFPLPPDQREPGDPPSVVRGLTVDLETHGAGSSKAVLDTPKPAKLVFHLTMFKRVRGQLEQETVRLAELAGKLTLLSRSKPLFVNGEPGSSTRSTLIYDDPELDARATAPEDAAPEAAEPLSETETPTSGVPRMLNLGFDAARFQNMLDLDGQNSRLLLPSKVDEFHYLELSVDLEVDGAIEAARENNDILDVLLLSDVPEPAPRYAIRLIDDVEQPLDGVEFSITHKETTKSFSTDSEGIAGMVAHSQATAQASLSDPEALKSVLKERWNEVRPRAPIEPGPEVLTFTPDQLETVIDLAPGAPQTVLVHPKVSLARLFGGAFDTNKNFLLPNAIPALRGMKQLYDENPNSKLLIVGHTDTSGTTSFNDGLSLKRAEAMAQYLKNDVEGWFARYSSSVPENERWGSLEDEEMIGSFPETASRPPDEGVILFYQKLHNRKLSEPRPPEEPPRQSGSIAEDGEVGPETRRALIEDYMAHDGTSLPEDIEITVHGAGEHFPLDAEGELDVAPADGQTEAEDRRVELFFFDGDFGIQPPVPGKNSKKDSAEYPEWRRRARQTSDFGADDPVRTLSVGWSVETIDSLPPETVLQLQVGGELVERTLAEGVRANGAVHFEFTRKSPTDPLTLAVDFDGEKLILWNEQVFANVQDPPVFEARLHDLEAVPDEPLEDPPDDDETAVPFEEEPLPNMALDEDEDPEEALGVLV